MSNRECTHTWFVIFLSPFAHQAPRRARSDTPCPPLRLDGGRRCPRGDARTRARRAWARNGPTGYRWVHGRPIHSYRPPLPPRSARQPRFDAARHVRVAHGLYPCFDTLAAAPTARRRKFSAQRRSCNPLPCLPTNRRSRTGPCPSWANACATSNPFQAPQDGGNALRAACRIAQAEDLADQTAAEEISAAGCATSLVDGHAPPTPKALMPAVKTPIGTVAFESYMSPHPLAFPVIRVAAHGGAFHDDDVIPRMLEASQRILDRGQPMLCLYDFREAGCRHCT